MRAAIGTAATPAEPINGLIFPLVITHISLPNSNPPMVLMQNASNPNPKIISVSICKNSFPAVLEPIEIPNNNVNIFIMEFCAVSDKRLVTPLSRSKFPNINMPSSGAMEGKSRQVNRITTIGNMIFSFLVTTRN